MITDLKLSEGKHIWNPNLETRIYINASCIAMV